MQSKFVLFILSLFAIGILYFIVKSTIKYFENKKLQNYNENDLEMNKLLEKSREEAERILEEKGIKKERGYCHRLWMLQKSILKEKYKINWKTPAETDHMKYD